MPPDSALEIRTSRLVLRPIQRKDATEMFGILADPSLYEFTGGRAPSSVESLSETYAVLERRRSPDASELWFNWVIREQKRGEPVGYVQATVASTQTHVAWVVGVPWQGCGYASEAARALVDWLTRLGVFEVRACVHPSHGASQKVALRAGLSRTDQRFEGEEVWMLERTHRGLL